MQGENEKKERLKARQEKIDLKRGRMKERKGKRRYIKRDRETKQKG